MSSRLRSATRDSRAVPAQHQRRKPVAQPQQPGPRQTSEQGGEEMEESGGEFGHRRECSGRSDRSIGPMRAAAATQSGSSYDLAASSLRLRSRIHMLALIQRVTEARVSVDGETIGAIGPGLLALVAIEPGDGDAQVARMAERLLGYRVFADARGG